MGTESESANAKRRVSHATARRQHRAVRECDLDLVGEFGTEWPQGGGRTVIFLGSRLANALTSAGIDAAGARNLGAVYAGDGEEVTVIKSKDASRMRRYGFRRRPNRRRACQ